MTFNEWWNQHDYSDGCKGNCMEAFKAGQKNCNCLHTDNSEVISNLKSKVKKLEAQIEKMKCCNNCNNTWNGYHLDICDKCFEMCNWELRK